MNLRHLSVFHGIAKAGSVNAAARLLHTSQPAVSRELRTLEERLGVLLFDRLPRGMRLTEAGKVLLDYAERIFGLDQAAERAMRELSDLEGGQLAIGASNTIGTYLLPAFVTSFHIRYPKVSLNLEIGNTQEIVKGVLDSRFALGFVEGRIRDEAMEAREFRRDRIVAVVAPQHPLAKGRALPVRALAESPSILREPGSGTREIVERAGAPSLHVETARPPPQPQRTGLPRGLCLGVARTRAQRTFPYWSTRLVSVPGWSSGNTFLGHRAQVWMIAWSGIMERLDSTMRKRCCASRVHASSLSSVPPPPS
jgi:DNA-binding transcriptional LysR family regulator